MIATLTRRHAALRLLALLGAGVVATTQAQDFATPPKAGAPRPLSIAAPVEQRLPNGLRVVLAERRGVQLVTAQLVVLSGSELDPPQQAGLAAMTAGLLTRGTRRHSATQLAQAAESLGGALDAGAGWHQSEVAITVTVPKVDAALALVSEVVQQPAFAQAELDRLRTQSLDELKVAYSRPGTLATLAVQRLLFGAGAYGHAAGGTPASLTRIARADLVAGHAARFRPDNAVLVLAGDLGPAAALQLARRHFGTWKKADAATLAPAPMPANVALAAGVVAIDMPQSGQAAVVVAAPLPPLGADRATAAVMNAVLGAGFSSRLNQEIRIRRGLSYSAGSGIDARPAGGALHAVVQTRNESAARGREPGPGRTRPAGCHVGRRRGTRGAQGHTDRRFQPRGRDDGGAGRSGEESDRRRAAAAGAGHAHRSAGGRQCHRCPALCVSEPWRSGPAHRRCR